MSNHLSDRPLQVRYKQKMTKYSRIADESGLLFTPAAVFSHTGQIPGAFKWLVKEQIRQILICFESKAKQSKVKSAMKW